MALTRQQMFDNALFGIRRQNYVKSERTYANDDDDEAITICCYRGENDAKCAIGHSVPDGRYKPEWDAGEGINAVTLIRDHLRDLFVGSDDNLSSVFDFADRLQQIHDTMKSAAGFETAMKEFAIREHVIYTPVTKENPA